MENGKKSSKIRQITSAGKVVVTLMKTFHLFSPQKVQQCIEWMITDQLAMPSDIKCHFKHQFFPAGWFSWKHMGSDVSAFETKCHPHHWLQFNGTVKRGPLEK